MVQEKVLIINGFSRGIGGAESFTEDLIKELVKTYHVHLVTTGYCGTWAGWHIWKALKIGLKLAPIAILKALYHRHERIYCLGLISAFIGFLLFWKKKYIIMLALYDFRKYNWFISLILNSAEKVFVEGETGKQDILRVGVREGKIIKFQHWVDQTRFYPIERHNERLRILFVGRPLPIKGRHIIEEVERQCGNYDMIFTYVDNVPYKDLPKYYQEADICVVPSLYSEGYVKVVAEAASCGCVVISSNRGALKDMVTPFGFPIEPTPEDFKKVILSLYNNRAMLKSEREHTIKYAREHFSDKNAEVFL